MPLTAESARAQLTRQVEALLDSAGSAESIVDLVIRTGWQPRPLPEPDSEYLTGVLANGREVTVEIRHGDVRRIPSWVSAGR